MTVPIDAALEAEPAGGIAVWDVSLLLPFGAGRYPPRDPEDIWRLYVHHSGALGPDGYRGALASARYVVQHREWPGAPYQLWVPYHPEHDAEGRLVIYRLQGDDVRSWHTGGAANGHGIGIALQGDLRESGPSASQVECLEALLPWLREQHELWHDTWLSWHSESDRWGGSGKPECPGALTVVWLRDYRERSL